MTQHSTKRRQILQDIQKQHEELVLQNAGTDSADAEKVEAFLKTIADAGKDIENPQERSLLSDLMYYWSGVAYKKTGHFPIIPLQPLNVTSIFEKKEKEQEDIAGRRKTRNRILIPLVIFFIFIVLVLPLISLFNEYESLHSANISGVPTLPTFSGGIGVFTAPNGDSIGISDGRFVLDSDRIDKSLKLQSAGRFTARDVSSAIALWNTARAQDTSDAEAAIYLEDQRVLASGRPYIALVVATTFQQSTPDYTSREILQGAYIAQREANAGCTVDQCTLVRLLIANSGAISTYAVTIAEQIVQVARNDRTLGGVIGWSGSSQTLNAIRVLASAHIPLLSQSASSDVLTSISPYFFRIVPPSREESSVAAKYATQHLQGKRIALFEDPESVSSQNLAQDFAAASGAGSIVTSEIYQTGQPGNFKVLIQNALTHKPDLIYFPGSVGDTLQTAGNTIGQWLFRYKLPQIVNFYVPFTISLFLPIHAVQMIRGFFALDTLCIRNAIKKICTEIIRLRARHAVSCPE